MQSLHKRVCCQSLLIIRPAARPDRRPARFLGHFGFNCLPAESVNELAAQISRDYAGRNPLLIGVLRGVVFFMSDLLRAITIPVRLDFIAISRYDPQGQGKGKGPVRLVKDLEETIEGQHLIFVEDVIDTGLTLSYLLRLLPRAWTGQPRSMHPVRQARPPSGQYPAQVQRI